MIRHGQEKGSLKEDEFLLKEYFKLKDIEMDDLESVKRIVQIIPDYYPAWNILKGYLKLNFGDWPDQLRLSQKAIEFNPKSYQAWHHRRCVFEVIQYHLYKKHSNFNTDDEIPFETSFDIEFHPNIELVTQKTPRKQVKFTNLIIPILAHTFYTDEKGLYIKNYGIIYEQELELTAAFLGVDERNFHCWNFRRFLVENDDLPFKMYNKDFSNYSCIHHFYNKKYTDNEIISKIFTCPYDEGLWQYYWVMEETQMFKNGVYMKIFDDKIEIKFKDKYKGTLYIKIGDKKIKVDKKVSYKNITVISKIKKEKKYILKDSNKKVLASGFLKRQDYFYDFVEELLEIEEDCNFALLTLLERTEDQAKRNKLIEKLVLADPKRKNYYKSLKYGYIISGMIE
ncbi:putative subunit alpha of protein prenyltransferase [Hamiltosporidium magnivora]|uniref:Geranylgeranyl transferase type-2 subunit alpha n=1 Tax=Hamiltosporidium magnivora TaxID=148818 RepID=A0A4Q9LK65_9MICR|nr:putative subunit alpha of protein prenyltransferase [Hamiltosporidium magnivora]